MTLFVRAVVRHHLNHPWMALSTFAGLWLALVAVVSVHLLTAAVAEQMRVSMPGAMMAVSHQIKHPTPTERDYFELRRRWRGGEFVGVAALVPMVEGRVGGYRVLGFDPLALVGDASLGGGSALMSGAAVLAHAGLGDLEDVLDIGGVRVKVAGRFGRAGQRSDLLVADIGLAQRLLGLPGELSAIGVVAADEPSALDAVLERTFPGITTPVVQSMALGEFDAEVVGDQAQQRFTGAILFNLGALSLLSAVVAGFLAYQSTVNGLRHRGVLLQRLDMMGVPGGLVVAGVLAESVVLALLAVPAALLAGRAVAAGLLLLTVGGAGEWMPTLQLDLWVVGKALVLALFTVMVSGLLAYRFVRGRHWRGVRVWIALASGGLVAVGLSLEGTGVAGALLGVLGCCLLMVSLIGVIVRWAMTMVDSMGHRFSVTTLVNLRSIGAGFPEVSAAMGALLIAAGTGMGIALMVESFRVAFEGMLDQRLKADLVISNPQGFAVDDIEMLASREGVVRLGRSGDGEARLITGAVSERVALHFVDLDEWEAARYGAVAGGGEAVLINEQAARRFGVGPGDTLALRGDAGPVQLSVAGVFSDYGEPGARLVLSMNWVDELGPVITDRVALTVESAFLSSVTSAASQRGWDVTSQREIRDFAEHVFGRTFRITDALTALALLVAVAGLYNALSALDVKREDEFRLLGMLGFDGSELRRMSLVQALALAGLVMVLAVPLGAGVAWILCDVLNPRAFGWSIDFRWSVTPVLVAVAAGMLAATVAGLMGRRGQW